MNWADVVPESRIVCGANCETKRDAIGLLSDLLASDLDLDSTTLHKAIAAREKLGPTTIGNGVLLPHTASELVETPTGALLLLDKPLKCPSPDDVAVDICIGILMPQDGKGIPLLAKLIQPLRNEDTLRELREADTPAAVLAALQAS